MVLFYELANCILCCKPNDSSIYEIETIDGPVRYRTKKNKRMFARDLAHIFYDEDGCTLKDNVEYDDILISILYDMTHSERKELIRLLVRQTERRMDDNIPVILLPENLMQLQADDSGDSVEDKTGINTGTDDQLETIVRYLDENSGADVNLVSLQDPSMSVDYKPSADLDAFLSRPQLIDTRTWAEGTALNFQLAPWTLFFNSTQVKKKLDNFSRLSCELHVKTIINASPFYYGAALFSYQPLPAITGTSILASLAAQDPPRIAAYTQRPHYWVLPQTNQGGEMTLPYFYWKNWMDITLVSTTNGMGVIDVRSPVELSNANSVVGAGVTIQTYAWATNVKLCGPTQALALQADRGSSGLISGPASAVASVSKALEQVPGIAPFAKATTMISSGVGSLAKLFGFTNVPNVEAVKPFKNLPFHSFASSEISQPIEKLTIDPKQELTIDPRTVGCKPDDELLLKNLVVRESYITQQAWTAAQPTSSILFKGNVCPYIAAFTNTPGVTYCNPSPMGHFCVPFKYWRGDIIYRFKVICSRFHRGRLLIQWDPNAKATPTVGDTNVVYSTVVDISEDTDVEFRVPYLGAMPFLRNTVNTEASFGLNLPNLGDSATAIPAGNNGAHNGQITVSVLTQQTSPVASADIVVLAFVRAADNMVFGGPQDTPSEISFMPLQADYSSGSGNLYGMDDKSAVLDDNAFAVNMGERITSMRQLLRRVNYSYTTTVNNASSSSTVTNILTVRHSPIPLYYGYDPNGIFNAESTLAPPASRTFNFVRTTMINWVLPCFIGWRGTINWHYNVLSKADVCDLKAWRSEVSQTSADYRNVSAITNTSINTVARTFFNRNRSGASGQSVLNQKTQTGLSVAYPMYSNFRMRGTQVNQNTLGRGIDETDTDRCAFTAVIPPYSADDYVNVEFYCSIGTDFNVFFFINTPTYVPVLVPNPI